MERAATTESRTDPITPFDRAISLSVAPFSGLVEQATSGGNNGAAATVHFPHAITGSPPLLEQRQAPWRFIIESRGVGGQKDS